ncbi:hypothetical protein, partial [Neisseria sp. P0019.S002]|uniref:hypothetical protein n=1 Tax=Neisseria sp. P0019.S002 TaxID=3436798 RepID=UPI003F7D6BB1
MSGGGVCGWVLFLVLGGGCLGGLGGFLGGFCCVVLVGGGGCWWGCVGWGWFGCGWCRGWWWWCGLFWFGVCFFGWWCGFCGRLVLFLLFLVFLVGLLLCLVWACLVWVCGLLSGVWTVLSLVVLFCGGGLGGLGCWGFLVVSVFVVVVSVRFCCGVAGFLSGVFFCGWGMSFGCLG